jgi:hypothetical protein
MSLRTKDPGLSRPRGTTVLGPGNVNVPDTCRGTGSKHAGRPQRRCSARTIPEAGPTHTHGRLIVAALIAALCGGCGQDKSGATHVSELAGQWMGKENDGSEAVCVSLRGDGTFEWRQQQVAGKKDAWSRAGQWKPVSLLGEDGGGFTYCLTLNVDPGAGDAAAAGPQPGPYEVRLSSRRTAREWMLYAPWGEFRVERAVEHGERGSRGREGETHDG